MATGLIVAVPGSVGWCLDGLCLCLSDNVLSRLSLDSETPFLLTNTWSAFFFTLPRHFSKAVCLDKDLVNEKEKERRKDLVIEGLLGGLWSLIGQIRTCRVSFGNNLYKLVLSASVYNLWRERNARLFSHRGRDTDSAFKEIEKDSRDRCCSWKPVVNTCSNRSLCLAWNLSRKILKMSGH